MTLPTQNTDWGFYGTVKGDKDAAWAEVSAALIEATKQSPEVVRVFLDGKMGRHLADEVSNSNGSIPAAIRVWANWGTSKAAQKELGLPPGTNYLIGEMIAVAKSI
mgnify:CR=1 FL=1